MTLGFYPSPVLAFGYCLWLRLSVCPSVRVCGNHFKLGSINLDHRRKRPWLRSLLFGGFLLLFFWWCGGGGGGGDWPWPSRSNLTLKSKVTLFWVCRHDNTSPVCARITKFGTKVQNTWVKIPINFGIDWFWSSIPFSILKPVFLPNLFALFCKYLVRPSLVYI